MSRGQVVLLLAAIALGAAVSAVCTFLAAGYTIEVAEHLYAQREAARRG